MKLIEIIPRKAIVHDLKATDKKGAITELVQTLKKAHPGEKFTNSGLVDAIMKREKLGTTGMGGGVAVPHAKLVSHHYHFTTTTAAGTPPTPVSSMVFLLTRT